MEEVEVEMASIVLVQLDQLDNWATEVQDK